MEADIRKFIIDNFKNDTEKELKESIDESIKEKIDETLPGMGVFFEIIWNNASEKQKDELVSILKAHLK